MSRRRPWPVAPVLWGLWAALMTLATAVDILEHSWWTVAGVIATGASWAFAVQSLRVYGRKRNWWLLAEHQRALHRAMAEVRTIVRNGGVS